MIEYGEDGGRRYLDHGESGILLPVALLLPNLRTDNNDVCHHDYYPEDDGDEDDHGDVNADGRPDLLHHKTIIKVCQVEVDHGHHGHLDTHHFHHDLHVVEHLTSLKIRKSKERKYIQVKFT